LKVPTLEKELGMEVYATQSLGIGGRIRQFLDDFVVEELLVDGSKAEVSPVETQKPFGRGRYLICVLVKRDWDTLLAVRRIAGGLGISSKRIRIAGMKDAKALTAQHISLQGVTPTRASQVKIKDIVLHSLRFSDRRIFSQLLLGNQFQVVIRAISHSSSVVEQRVKNVQNELMSLGGFPNFYGHQRFGTIRPITHLVGRFLARGELEKAVFVFLAQPSIHEHPESREAREQLRDTRDFEEALRCFPRHLRYECFMLGHLAKYPRDFVGAFRELPLNLRKLFVQAYQSFLFNKFLSERIRRGIPLNETQIGDYVVKLDDHGLPTTEFMQVAASSLQTVKEALKEGKMRVAIPLVGFKQPPSQGVQGEIEKEILETENVNLQNFRISFMPEVSAGGELRIILGPITNLSVEEISKDSANPSKRKTRLSFTLHRGSYATVLLREFMKCRNLIKAGF
jgi:tRNA pseudouridine13 synthase